MHTHTHTRLHTHARAYGYHYLFIPFRDQALQQRKAGFNSSNISPWVTLAGLVLTSIGVVMLITIYVSMPSVKQSELTVVSPPVATTSSTNTPTSSATSTSTTTTTTTSVATPTTARCVCPGYSAQSLFFPYGKETNDIMKDAKTIVYPVKRGIVYTILGDNRGLTPLNVTMVSSFFFSSCFSTIAFSRDSQRTR